MNKRMPANPADSQSVLSVNGFAGIFLLCRRFEICFVFLPAVDIACKDQRIADRHNAVTVNVCSIRRKVNILPAVDIAAQTHSVGGIDRSVAVDIARDRFCGCQSMSSGMRM